MAHSVATPALLCHKEPAQCTQSTLNGGFLAFRCVFMASLFSPPLISIQAAACLSSGPGSPGLTLRTTGQTSPYSRTSSGPTGARWRGRSRDCPPSTRGEWSPATSMGITWSPLWPLQCRASSPPGSPHLSVRYTANSLTPRHPTARYTYSSLTPRHPSNLFISTSM